MKSRASLSFAALAVLLALALAVGCSRAPNDAQIANQVQSKIAADGNIQNKQINVQSANGVVTLAGTVGSDMERTAAGNDAAQVAGVKTVINNLTTSPQAVAQQGPPPAEQPPAQEPTMQAAPRRARPSPAGRAPRNTASAPVSEQPGSIPVSAPVAPATPRTVTVPEGTGISIRLIDPIDSDRNQVGDTFRATLAQPISVGDEVVVPMGADVEGRIAEVKSAGHYTGQSALALELVRMSVNGKSYQLRTNQYTRQGASRGKNTAAKVGGGAALGAIIGGIAGGGKGAAIGAGVGAGAGTGVQTITKGQQIKLPSETVLNFNLEAPLNVTPTATRRRSGE